MRLLATFFYLALVASAWGLSPFRFALVVVSSLFFAAICRDVGEQHARDEVLYEAKKIVRKHLH